MNLDRLTRASESVARLLLLAVVTANLCPRATATTLTINAVKRSNIKGWGVFPSYSNGAEPTQNYFGTTKPAVRDAVYGLAQSFVRLELSGGYYKSADANFSIPSITFNTKANEGGWIQDRFDYLINEMTIAQSKGVSQYILSSWSPPDAFKTVGTPTTTGAVLDPHYPIRYGKAMLATQQWIRTCLRQDREQAYCNWYCAAIKYLVQQTGWTPSAISLQNEPSMWDIRYSGCYWEAPQYYRVAKLMRATLDANGLGSIPILGHEDTFKVTTSTDHSASPSPVGLFEWAFPVLDPSNPRYDAALSAAIGGYAFHSYDIGDQWGTAGGISGVAAHGGPTRDCWMTEWNDHNEPTGDGGGTAEIDYSIKCFRHFACDFVTCPYNYWCYWTAWTKETGAINGPDLLGSQVIGGVSQPILSQKYPIFQKIFATVQPGSWVSKTVASDDVELQSKQDQYGQYQPNLVSLIAFEKNDATASLLVIANPSTSNRAAVVLKGLKGSSATVYQTTSSQTMTAVQAGAVTAGQFTLSNLPPRCVVLVISNNLGPIVSGSIYKVIAVHSGKAMETNGNSTLNDVHQWTYSGGANQKWKVESVGTSLFKLTAQSNQYSLAISTQYNGGLDPGCVAVTQNYSSAANQIFRLEQQTDGSFRIVANGSGFPLDVAGANQNDGATIAQWWDTSLSNQRWRFEAP